MADVERLEKLKRRIGMVASKAHALKIVESFREEDRALAREILSGILPEESEAENGKENEG